MFWHFAARVAAAALSLPALLFALRFFQRGVDLVQLSLLGGDLSLQLVLLGVSQRHDISGEGHGKG